MKYEVVTSMSRNYYDKVGNRMIDSFLQNWPDEIDLRVYTEDELPRYPKENFRVEEIDLFERVPRCKQFIDRHKDAPKQQNPKELYYGAVRFAPKSYSAIHAGNNTLADYLIWLDADVFTHTKIPVEFLDSLVEQDVYTTYLGRRNSHPETGFVIYNCRHELHSAFMAMWETLYNDDTIFHLKEWHDAFVFGYVREYFEKHTNIKNKNLSPNGQGFDHVFINSDLGKYMDHMKGPRKYEGKSRQSDLTTKREEGYWKQ